MKLNSKPKVLILTDWFEPGYKAGGPVRSISNLVRALAEKIDFFVVTGDRDFGDSQPYRGVKIGIWNKKENFSVLYLPKKSRKFTEFWKLISVENFQSIYLNSLFSVHYSLTPLFLLKIGKINSKVILAPRGMLGQGALEIKSRKKGAFLRLSKLIGLYKNVFWHSTSLEEENDIKSIIGSQNVFTVPNVNTSEIFLGKSRMKIGQQVKLTFISRISIKKNLLYFLKILESSNLKKGMLLFDIYGPIEDDKYWEECHKILNKLPPGITIKYKGELDYSQVAKTLVNYEFFILPTKNENYGHAIVEAGLTGCVPIISDQTPWHNLEDKKAGWDISLKDEKKFLEVLNKCLNMENEEYQRYSQNCIAYFKEKVKDKRILERYFEMFSNPGL